MILSEDSKLIERIKKKLAISLETESTVNNEYYTKEHMVAFRKTKKSNKKSKLTKKRSRKPVRTALLLRVAFISELLPSEQACV
jgi:hypothetical protein